MRHLGRISPLVWFAVLTLSCARPEVQEVDFEVAEATLETLQSTLAAGDVTSVQLVDLYRARIRAYDDAGPRLNTMVRLNPNASTRAAELDAERAAGGVRGPLHGVPVLMKDNYDVVGMPTTGGSLALAGSVPADDAFQVARLREAGAVILGKTNLHELALGITTISSLGGQTRNPYDPSRNPGGSSGGTGAAVAASFAPIGWGSDTCGSIRIPASVHNLFGLRPTKGLSSIDGILPLAHSQDTGGPLARSVRDLAIALDATVGRDPADPATALLDGTQPPVFQDALDTGALAGARIGVFTDYMVEGGATGEVTEIVRAALSEMESLGAELVDVSIPGFDTLMSNTGLIDYEFKFDLIDYLATIPEAPVSSLTEILDAGLHHQALNGAFRRRAALEERMSADHEEVLERRARLARVVNEFMERMRVDALAYPTMRQQTALIGAAPVGSSCALSAHTGLPALTMPAGFSTAGLPVGLELLGRALDDARLVGYAYAFEAAFPKRRPPLRTPPLDGGQAPGALAVAVLGDDSERIDASLFLDVVAGALRYDISLPGIVATDALGVVLRRVEDDGTAVVVLALSGPERSNLAGEVSLDPRTLQDLVEGRIELVSQTRQGYTYHRLELVEGYALRPLAGGS